jgi:hypothetical protein
MTDGLMCCTAQVHEMTQLYQAGALFLLGFLQVAVFNENK